MARKISIKDLENAVYGAYEEYKSLKEGEVDPRVADESKGNSFGISVVLTDGTVISKGDTTVPAALGDIANFAVHTVLLQQLGAEGLAKKAGKTSSFAVHKLHLPVSAHGLRATSAVTPQNDPDGKYDIILNNFINMAGSAPVFDDKLYTELRKEASEADVENKLAGIDYELYDDAQTAINVFTKLEALKVTTEQLATFGATIAADGVNPRNNQVVFDGELSAPMVTVAAAHGKPDRNRRWLLKAGVPAVYSFSGLILAIMPGVGAIAAYSPEVCKHGRSKKGSRAIAYITNALNYNVFSSARLEVVK